METITIQGKEYHVKKNEFVLQPHREYNNLRIYPKVGELERIIGLLQDLVENRPHSTLLVYDWSHGGFVPQGCTKKYETVHVVTNEVIPFMESLPRNLLFRGPSVPPDVIYLHEFTHPNYMAQALSDLHKYPLSYVLCPSSISIPKNGYIEVPLSNSSLVLYVPQGIYSLFQTNFHYYITPEGVFDYDNLIHLCIMVKNAGPLFEKVLTENLPIIDRWTILDTGSTDGTQDIVRKVLQGKKGTLYEEPFINFRESRNRCLDLAGTHCKYLLMLDDTYALRNDLRQFLNVVRGDQFASSYSLLILSDDTEYYSNRVTFSERGLRYIYTIHEVIQDTNNKENVVIPKEAAYIHDHRADYMEKRTMDRKRYDLQLLHDMVKEDPTNPRHYYYLAQTYNLLEDYENAAFWFRERATTKLKGHDQEAVDSWFELARTYNFKLNKPWEDCKKAYEEAFKMDPSRPEALYFIGIHYYLEHDNKTAYEYFKQAFALGYPIHAQFSLKPTLVYHFLPKFLAQLCYEFADWPLGLQACLRFLHNNKPDADQYTVVASWYPIFDLLCKLPNLRPALPSRSLNEKPIVVFVADGGWGPWTGSDIMTKGVGGSETYMIEIARWVQASGKYQVYVFCKCSKPEIFEGVIYSDLSNYPEFLVSNRIHSILVSRYSEYVPISLQATDVKNVYMVLHDLGPTGLIIPTDPKLKKILCLTDWHVSHFLETFPQFKDRTESLYYGIDTSRFKPSLKVKNSFIYSSFPNRGLLPLLQMWPKIKEVIPDATLNVYSDVNGKWVNEVAKEQMDEIRYLLASKELKGVTMHGWVSKGALADAWSKADIWFYPCIFKETFCLTALEAAATKTLAIGPPLAALQETIGNRGILLPGDPMTQEWQEKALKEIVEVVSNSKRKQELLEKNYKWAIDTTWRRQAEEFMRRYLNESKSQSSSSLISLGEPISVPSLTTKKKDTPQRLLEVNGKSAESIIHFLTMYSEATALVIQNWKKGEEEKEKEYERRIQQAGMKDRITIWKGDGIECLMELVRKDQTFDWIWIETNVVLYEEYTKIVIAWNRLEANGTMEVNTMLDAYGFSRLKEFILERYLGLYQLISNTSNLILYKL